MRFFSCPDTGGSSPHRRGLGRDDGRPFPCVGGLGDNILVIRPRRCRFQCGRRCHRPPRPQGAIFYLLDLGAAFGLAGASRHRYPLVFGKNATGGTILLSRRRPKLATSSGLGERDASGSSTASKPRRGLFGMFSAHRRQVYARFFPRSQARRARRLLPNVLDYRVCVNAPGPLARQRRCGPAPGPPPYNTPLARSRAACPGPCRLGLRKVVKGRPDLRPSTSLGRARNGQSGRGPRVFDIPHQRPRWSFQSISHRRSHVQRQTMGPADKYNVV